MQTHTVFYVLKTDALTKNTGIGEAAPLPGLSIDFVENFESHLQLILN